MAGVVGVRTKHPEYDKFAKKWKRCRDVVAGQDEIHLGGSAYLPMLKDEDALEYAKRIQRTPFFNATWRTIAGFVGMLYRKPAVVTTPKALEKYLEDVTMSGVSFPIFAQDVTYEDLIISRVGVYVDHPPLKVNADGTPLSVADAERLGQRPSMQMYNAESIINHRYGFVNNRTVLTQVKLVEEDTIVLNEFQEETLKIIRVLDLDENNEYRVRKFREDNSEQIGEDVYPLMNGKRMNEITFYFIGPDGTDGKYEEPIMIDLVDLNIKHYQVSADYEHGCHMTALPTPWVAGQSLQFNEAGVPIDQKLYIGSTTAWLFPDSNTKVGFLEFQGTGLAALEKNLERKEAQMAAIGARMLAPEKAGVEAAQTLAMRHSGEHSILGAVAVAVSSGLTKALQTFAAWCGVAGECKIEINRDFIPLAVDPATLQGWLALVNAGRMSGETLFDLLQRGDIIAGDVTYEEEQTRIDSDPVPRPIPPGHEPAVDPKADDEEDQGPPAS